MAFAYSWQNLIFTWTLSTFVLADLKMTATCLLLPDVFGDDPSLFVIVNEKVCSMSVITGFDVSHLHMIIYLKTGWWSLLKYGFIIFTNMLHYDKFIYCNIMVKLRHILLFSYYPHHRVLSLLSIISGASFHTRVRSQEPFQCRCLRIFFVFRKREAHKGR